MAEGRVNDRKEVRGCKTAPFLYIYAEELPAAGFSMPWKETGGVGITAIAGG